MNQRRYVYFFYVLIILLILWLTFQLSKIYIGERRVRVPKVAEFFQDTLTVVLPGLPEHAENFKAFWDVDWFLSNQLYRGLTRINSDLSVSPDLAEYWEISDDRKVYTFYLRDDIFFQDGTPITTDDVIYSIHYFFRNYKDVYAIHYFYILEGVNDYIKGRSQRIAGIEKVSDRVVRFYLKHPYVPFLKIMSMPYMRVLPARLLKKQGHNFFKHPVGSGPFELVSMNSHSILLKASTANRIYSPGVQYFKFVNSMDTTFQDDFWERKWDICTIYTDSFMIRPGYLKYHKNVSLSSIFIGFNCERPPTNNPWFRRFLFYAITTDTTLKHLAGVVAPSEFISPIYLPVHRQKTTLVHTNLDKARDIYETMFSGAQASEPPELVAVLDTGEFDVSFRETLRLVRDSLHIPIRILYRTFFKGPTVDPIINKINLFFFDWELDLGDPGFFFGLLFYSDSPLNIFRYHNPKVDSLIDLARYQGEYSKRLQIYSEVEKIIYHDAPVRPLFNFLNYVFYKDYICGAFTNRFGISGLNLEHISVNKELFLQHNWRRR